VLWFLERRRARSSCSVRCRWYDWRRPLSRSAVLFTTLWHYRELSDERYAYHIQFEFWLLRRLTPTVTHRTPPVLRRRQSFRRCRLLRSCSNASAAQRLLLAASYIFLVTFSVFYTMLQTPLSESADRGRRNDVNILSSLFSESQCILYRRNKTWITSSCCVLMTPEIQCTMQTIQRIKHILRHEDFLHAITKE